MPATVTQIFSGATNPAQIDQTATFSGADFLFFDAPALPPGDAYEVAAALVIDIVGTEVIGGLPIPTAYGTKEIPLGIEAIETTTCVRIPMEFAQSRLNMRLCLATSYAIALNVYTVSSGTFLPDLQTEIDGLEDLLSGFDITDLLTALEALATVLPAVLSVVTSLEGVVQLLLVGVPLLLP